MNSPLRVGRVVRAGFTIIELLVTIGIIGMLVSILLPALAGARQSARETQSLSNLRSTGQTFAAYANQYRVLPYRAPGDSLAAIGGEGGGMGPIPGRPGIVFFRWWPSGVIIGMSDPFVQQWMWPGIVAEFSAWPDNYATWVSPGRPNTLPDSFTGPSEIENMVSYRYACPFFSKPELYKPGVTAPITHEDEARLLGATRPDDVRHASAKVMLWDAHLAYLRREPVRVGEWYDAPTPMAFADGHGEVRNPTQATAGVANVMRAGLASPINGTPDGVNGRDY